MRLTYLDNNATTPALPEVVEAMLPMFAEEFGNPSSAHEGGKQAARRVAEARKSVARLIGAASETEIIFTSGGTEADTTALFSALATRMERNELVLSAVEHPAVLAAARELEASGTIHLHLIPVHADGALDLDAYRAALSPRVALVSLMWANNESGVIFPIPELAALAHEAGALFHSDAVQAAGKLKLDVAESGVDMLSLSAHKLHGPKGIGALYLRKGVAFSPLFLGGKQERARRAGTENTPAIVGFGKAAELAISFDDETLSPLRDRLEQAVQGLDANCRILGRGQDRLPNTSLMSFKDLESEALVSRLARAGVAVSSGSACAAGSSAPSHVLEAMGVPPDHLHGAVRFSLSRLTTQADVDHVLAVLPDILQELRLPRRRASA